MNYPLAHLVECLCRNFLLVTNVWYENIFYPDPGFELMTLSKAVTNTMLVTFTRKLKTMCSIELKTNQKL